MVVSVAVTFIPYQGTVLLRHLCKTSTNSFYKTWMKFKFLKWITAVFSCQILCSVFCFCVERYLYTSQQFWNYLVPNLLCNYRLLDSLVVECWLRVRKVPGFNQQLRTASYQRRYKNGTSSFLVWHSTFKRENTGSFWRIKIGK